LKEIINCLYKYFFKIVGPISTPKDLGLLSINNTVESRFHLNKEGF